MMPASASHVPFQPRGPRVELDADFVVVGSGAGGASAAVRLARAGYRVALAEAGAYLMPEDYPSSAYGAMRDLLENWGTNLAEGRALWPVVQGRAVGGTTVVNSAICVRTPGDVFRLWQAEQGVGGDAMAETLWRIQDELERELGAQAVPEATRGRSSGLAALGASRRGLEGHAMVRYAPGCEGSGQCLQGCRKHHKKSLNVTFVPELMARGGAVLSCAHVERVQMAGGRAVAVTGRFVAQHTRERGAEFRLRARHAVLVAASVTHSAPLLMRSGLRHRALGEGFRAHPGTPVLGLYDEPVDMNRGATQGWASLAFRSEPGFKLETLSLPLEMLAGRIAGAGRELMSRLADFRHLAMWVQACRAEAVGSVRPGLFGRPRVRYAATPRDMLRMRAAMLELAKLHVDAGARAVIPQIHGLPYALAPADIGLIGEAPLDPRAYVAVLSHLFGGAVMGRDPARSVVDHEGRVHGVEGLVVADASVIPSTLGVNPQHTIMALACHFAERLAERASLASGGRRATA